MKQAFAKLMEKDPVQSSLTAFRAGGNNVPILTRASSQSVAGVQTMGLPTGSKPFPGGGANKTVLGAIRMGDQDGNSPGSAIISSDIFYPPGQPDREYPERTFANVGNNVYQPENNDAALLALLKRLGDQQFKAKAMQPFEDYRVQQAQAAAIAEASRNASLSDTGTGREVLRSMVAERRAQSEADYMRRMAASGVSPEAAQKELQAIKDANAIQEAKRVDDRDFQAKNLIQKMAAARGITPMARESLSQSGAITNPQPSQAMSQAMGMPGQGAGSSPLEAGRQPIDSDFYDRARTLRADAAERRQQEQAFAMLASEGQIPEPDQGSFSLATLQGQERQQQVEGAAEALAARLETIRSRGSRILKPLPPVIIAKDVLDKLYAEKGKKAGAGVLFSSETIQDMNPLQLLNSMNLLLSTDSRARSAMMSAIKATFLGTTERPAPGVLNSLKKVVQEMNRGEPNISIPFASSSTPITSSQIVTILQDARGDSAIQRIAAAALKGPASEENSDSPFGSARQAIEAVPVPGAPARPVPIPRASTGSQSGRVEPPRGRSLPPSSSTDPTTLGFLTNKKITDELKRYGLPSTVTKQNRSAAIRRLNEARAERGIPGIPTE